MSLNRGSYGRFSSCPLSTSFETDLLDPFLQTYKNKTSRVEIRRRILTICTYFYEKREIDYEFHHLDLSDATHYFSVYLPSLCEKRKLSVETLRAELSAARAFGTFLEKRISFLRENDIGFYLPYENPFSSIVLPSQPLALRTDTLLDDTSLDEVLSHAHTYNFQLYILFLLAFRMMLPTSTILSLNHSMFSFTVSAGHLVGVLSYEKTGCQTHMRIPADIVQDVKRFYDSRTDGPLFLNQRGNRMSTVNLSHLLTSFRQETGITVTLNNLRSKGILDLLSTNPDAIDEIADYTGLSQQMLIGYSAALNHISESCIADKGSYRIIERKR